MYKITIYRTKADWLYGAFCSRWDVESKEAMASVVHQYLERLFIVEVDGGGDTTLTYRPKSC